MPSYPVPEVLAKPTGKGARDEHPAFEALRDAWICSDSDIDLLESEVRHSGRDATAAARVITGRRRICKRLEQAAEVLRKADLA